MRLEVVTISPTDARAMLAAAAGTKQRGLSIQRVDRIAHAIKAGQWKTTHQAIAFDEDGILIDGQHRLSAIEASGQSVDVLVAYDADPTTFDVLDLRGTRTTADSLKIAGYQNTSVLASIARYVLIYDAVKGTRRAVDSKLRGIFSSTDVLELLDGPRGDTIARAMSAAGSIADGLGRPGAKTAIGAALVAIIEAGAPDDLLEEFVDDLARGAMLPTTSPLFAFRRWLGGMTGYQKAQHRDRGTLVLVFTIKTWNAWIAKRPVQTLYWRPSEPIPIPIADAGVDLEALEERLRAEETASA